MIDVNDLRKGTTFELDGSLFKVLDYHHNKPGRGNATIRVRTVNLRSGTNLEMTFTSGDRVQDVRLLYHNVQYLYNDGQFYHFMDLDTYEQPALTADVLGESAQYLKEGLEVKLTYYDNEPIDVELPTSVDLLVTEADIAVRGDTATGVNKKVMTETGLQVQVPSFVEAGNTIRVDTRTGAYVTRVKLSTFLVIMRTPAGKECRFFYGDYYRGRDHEECRLLLDADPPLIWKRDMCTTCPVPEILLANACEFMVLKPSLVRSFPFTKQQVRIRAYCTKTKRDVTEPQIGCGECHTLPPIFERDNRA